MRTHPEEPLETLRNEVAPLRRANETIKEASALSPGELTSRQRGAPLARRGRADLERR